MQCASTSTYPENLGSGGQLPAELRDRVCRFFVFLFVCPLRYDARHRKPRRFVYALNLGGMGISFPDKNPPGQNPPGQKTPGEKVPSGDIFYCSSRRQLNHSSCYWYLSSPPPAAVVIRRVCWFLRSLLHWFNLWLFFSFLVKFGRGVQRHQRKTVVACRKSRSKLKVTSPIQKILRSRPCFEILALQQLQHLNCGCYNTISRPI